MADAHEHNLGILHSTGPNKDHDLDWAAWRKTQEEIESNVVEGPFFSLAELPTGTRLLRRSALGSNMVAPSSARAA